MDDKFGSAWGGHVLLILLGHIGWRLLFSYTRFELRDRSKIRIWDDGWWGEMTLKDDFPNLYNIARVKDAFVAVNLDFSSGFLQ